jgi:hypothetical protein
VAFQIRSQQNLGQFQNLFQNSAERNAQKPTYAVVTTDSLVGHQDQANNATIVDKLLQHLNAQGETRTTHATTSHPTRKLHLTKPEHG